MFAIVWLGFVGGLIRGCLFVRFTFDLFGLWYYRWCFAVFLCVELCLFGLGSLLCGI